MPDIRDNHRIKGNLWSKRCIGIKTLESFVIYSVTHEFPNWFNRLPPPHVYNYASYYVADDRNPNDVSARGVQTPCRRNEKCPSGLHVVYGFPGGWTWKRSTLTCIASEMMTILTCIAYRVCVCQVSMEKIRIYSCLVKRSVENLFLYRV